MEFIARLRRLWQYRGFRRLLVVRIAAQIADGVTQMGMVSFALFSPQQQASGWAVAGVLAVTLLPFSIVGPFTGVLLDRWPRQRMVMVTESVRLAVCLAIAAVIWATAHGSVGGTVATYILVLVALSFNRFLLSGLGAGLADVVPEKAYLDASSVMPMLGPIGLVSGGIIAGIIRLAIGSSDPVHVAHANAIIFCAAALCCCATVAFNSRIGRLELGPIMDGGYKRPESGGPGQILRGLGQGYAYLRKQSPVTQGLWAISIEHGMYGVVMTCMIIAYRNYFHSASDPNSAIVDIGIWSLASGIGFAASGIVAPSIAHRIGIRKAVMVLLAASAVIQAVPGSIFVRPMLVLAALISGVCIQSIKVCADALTQIYVEDEYRGRVFALYDMLNNVTLVLGALVAAVIAPARGLSLPVFLGVAAVLAIEWAVFTLLSRGWANDPRAAGAALEPRAS
ncbi:MAG: MFS transporter [Propionibacteriaceae bacterium]|nr:MFS transporter [Propionibacteriaceae bacterium]